MTASSHNAPDFLDMRNHIRTLIAAWKVAPYTRFRAADHRSWTYDRLARDVAEAAGHTVVHGPYKGMKYFDSDGVPIVDRQPTMKLIGSFEEEIHPWIELLAARGFEKIVHLGSTEGYHAVGLALRIPESRSVVFDTLLASRRACWSLAQQNGVASRIQLRGFCDEESLSDLDFAGSLVFSDCGGAELLLLDPRQYPSLKLATILVETHDAFDFRITTQLKARFRGTHAIDGVEVRERNPRDYPFVDRYQASTARMALEEARSITKEGNPQLWLLMTPLES